MTLDNQLRNAITRRYFFRECGVGVGALALATLLRDNDVYAAPAQALAANPLAPKAPHFAAKAKRVIYLFQAGAPSQLDLFDFKPALVKYDGKPVPAEVVKDQRYAFIRPDAELFASKFKFAPKGKCGAELSEVLPHLAEVVDDKKEKGVSPTKRGQSYTFTLCLSIYHVSSVFCHKYDWPRASSTPSPDAAQSTSA